MIDILCALVTLGGIRFMADELSHPDQKIFNFIYRTYTTRKMKSLFLCLIALVMPVTAHAVGYALTEQSASGLGNAFAGMAARSDDPSTQYYNPATMVFMKKGTQLSVVGNVIAPHVTLDNASASRSSTAINGNGGGNAGVVAVIPNFYLKTDLGNSVALGVGVTTPFGLSTKYNDGWVGRYIALESKVETINVNPAAAWKINERFSVGGGVSVQYMRAKLTSAIDSRFFCGGCVPEGNAATDSGVKLEGDDISMGFNLGTVFKPDDQTTLGVAYRSKIQQNLKGTATFTRSSVVTAALPLLTQSGMGTQLNLPENIAFSGAFQASPKLELLADATWTNWSRFKELRINFDTPAQAAGSATSTTTENWNNSWRYSVGTNYKYSSSVVLRTGVAYDQTVIPDNQHRTPRIPDQSRTWISLGAGWALSPKNTLDVGYAHLFIKSAATNNTSEGSLQYNIRGDYSSSVDLLSVQLTHSF
jgi:long-chain fatty acid transport protein